MEELRSTDYARLVIRQRSQDDRLNPPLTSIKGENVSKPETIREALAEFDKLTLSLVQLCEDAADTTIVADRMFEDGVTFNPDDYSPLWSWVLAVVPELEEFLEIDRDAGLLQFDYSRREVIPETVIDKGLVLPAQTISAPVWGFTLDLDVEAFKMLWTIEKSFYDGTLEDHLPFTLITDEDGEPLWQESNLRARVTTSKGAH